MFQFLKSLPLTFYSAPFYRELLRSGKGIGLWFLVIATFLNAGAMTAQMAEPARLFMAEQAPFFESLPALTVKNGEITTDPPGPLTLSILEKAKEGPMKIRFDPQAETEDLPALTQKMRDEKIIVLVTKNKVAIFDPAQDKTEIRDAKSFQDTEVSHEQWIAFGNTLGSLLLPGLGLFLIGLFFTGHLITAFLGGLLIMILAPLFRLDPPLAGAMRIAAAAKVPVATAFLVLSPHLPMQAALWFGFAAFGLLANRVKET